MRRAVNSTEVARRAGVSRTTVSFVLNGSNDAERIPLATRERILRAADELGYSPNHLARVLTSGRSYLINLLVRHVHPTFFSRAIEAFNAALHGSGYDLRIQETAAWTPERWQEVLKDRWPVDGTIVLEEAAFVPLLVQGDHSLHPVVSVGSAFCTDVDHVGIDLHTGAVIAVQHLFESGHRNIAFVGPSYYTRTTRWEGYDAEVRQMGQEPCLMITSDDWKQAERARARTAVETFLQSNPCPDALFCFNDEFAIGALRAVKDRGLRVPEDVVIVGCDDIDDTQYHDPPLSTLHYPYEEAAQLAWDCLRRRIEVPDRAALPMQSFLLKPELVLRQSSIRSVSSPPSNAVRE
jgi:DNA-binding LacI/PurR family transcriptional regulator